MQPDKSSSLHLEATRASLNLKNPAAAADDGRAVLFPEGRLSSPHTEKARASPSPGLKHKSLDSMPLDKEPSGPLPPIPYL